MNATLIAEETKVQTAELFVAEGQQLTELYAVELAYVGGGMANVAFM